MVYRAWNPGYVCTYSGSGCPSASHSIMNGLSLSLFCCATLKSSSSVGGCLVIRGGELSTERERERSRERESDKVWQEKSQCKSSGMRGTSRERCTNLAHKSQHDPLSLPSSLSLSFHQFPNSPSRGILAHFISSSCRRVVYFYQLLSQ